MRFALPLLPVEYELPNEWWTTAGMQGFTPFTPSFLSGSSAIEVALREIEPPFRFPEYPKDRHGFDRERMICVLKAIAEDVPLPPVQLLILPPLQDISRPPFRYRVLDGFHRFYAAVAAGFERLPATTRECCM